METAHKQIASQKGFTDLPAELGLMIYKHLLVKPGCHINVRFDKSSHGLQGSWKAQGTQYRYDYDRKRRPTRKVLGLGIFRLCHKIHEESTVFFFSHNHFSLPNILAFHDFLTMLGRMRIHLRSLSLYDVAWDQTLRGRTAMASELLLDATHFSHLDISVERTFPTVFHNDEVSNARAKFKVQRLLRGFASLVTTTLADGSLACDMHDDPSNYNIFKRIRWMLGARCETHRSFEPSCANCRNRNSSSVVAALPEWQRSTLPWIEGYQQRQMRSLRKARKVKAKEDKDWSTSAAGKETLVKAYLHIAEGEKLLSQVKAKKHKGWSSAAGKKTMRKAHLLVTEGEKLMSVMPKKQKMVLRG